MKKEETTNNAVGTTTEEEKKEKRTETKKEIEDLLRSTKREGIDELLNFLEEQGFYDAPASTQYHGSEEGALAEHSLNVYKVASAMAKTFHYKNTESIIICALLHDVGKMGQFGKPLYVPNILKSGQQSESKPYQHNKDLLDLPHEVTSIVEVSKYIELTEDEQLAIAWHNGLYGAFRYDIQGKETVLYMLIHWADMWASRIMER